MIVSVDGVGEWESAVIAYGEDNRIIKLQSIDFPHSLGMFYSAFTAFLGFKPLDIVFMYSATQIWGILVHTEHIGNLGWLENILVTPSHHRVHHASNPKYLDKSKVYIISLSGGVDSMVTSYVMKNLGYKIVAVHISYMNRDICELEVELVSRWCDIIGIDLYIRKITEIQREPCMKYGLRDIYESYTRDIRFNAYRNCANIIGSEIPPAKSQSIRDDLPIVLLGHNHDDAFENILTNISSVSHLDNLLGMSQSSIISGINFIRPMLEIPKADIYKFANTHYIPYLPTSTPAWSQRGKIRDCIKPALQDWSPKLIPAMFQVSAKISSMSKIVDMYVKQTYEDIKTKGYLDIDILDLNLEEYYWDKLFKLLGYMISLKSLNNFIEKLVFLRDNSERYKISDIVKLNLNKDKQIKFVKIDDKKYKIYL